MIGLMTMTGPPDVGSHIWQRVAAVLIGIALAGTFALLSGCGGKSVTPPTPKPTGATVNIRVREVGGGNVSVKGAKVEFVVSGGEKQAFTTDANGKIQAASVTKGPRHLYVRKSGYQPYDQHFEVVEPVTSLTVAIAKKVVRPNPPPPDPNPPPPSNGPRTPDPAPGQRLPLPSYGLSVVQSVANQYPGDLRNSCQNKGGSWQFLDRVVDELRKRDTRWGYNCKRGNCGDPSHDVVAYHGGRGPTTIGNSDVYVVDMIVGHCGPTPSAGWLNHGYGPGSAGSGWTSRGRF